MYVKAGFAFLVCALVATVALADLTPTRTTTSATPCVRLDHQGRRQHGRCLPRRHQAHVGRVEHGGEETRADRGLQDLPQRPPESGQFNLMLVIKYKSTGDLGPDKARYDAFMKEWARRATRRRPTSRRRTTGDARDRRAVPDARGDDQVGSGGAADRSVLRRGGPAAPAACRPQQPARLRQRLATSAAARRTCAIWMNSARFSSVIMPTSAPRPGRGAASRSACSNRSTSSRSVPGVVVGTPAPSRRAPPRWRRRAPGLHQRGSRQDTGHALPGVDDRKVLLMSGEQHFRRPAQ